MAKKQSISALLFCCLLLQPSISREKALVSNWDLNLSNITLENVRIKTSSLSAAWKDISTDYLVRSVLVTSDRAFAERPFDYQSRRGSVREFYDAIAATYNMARTHDERTGVTWCHPADLPYHHVLNTPISVDQDHLGLPMQSGILEPLSLEPATEIKPKRWGTLFTNTFNYAVDVPTGEHTARDILNLCCVANPTKSFMVQSDETGTFVTAVNLVSDKVRPAPIGALRWWDSEIGHDPGNDAPTQAQVTAALADSSPDIRRAARNYLEAIIWSIDFDGWVKRGLTTEQTLWMCVGLTSVLVRSEEATHKASIEMMERLAADDFLNECEPALAMMTALDFARLTKNARALEIVKKRNLKADELAGIIPDACRIASLSAYVRKVLHEASGQNSTGISKVLTEIARLAGEGELRFKLPGVT